jgi:hypothetical protein
MFAARSSWNYARSSVAGLRAIHQFENSGAAHDISDRRGSFRLQQSQKRRHQHQAAPADRRCANGTVSNQLIQFRPT